MSNIGTVRALGVPVSTGYRERVGFISFVNPYSLYKISQSNIPSCRIDRLTFYADGLLLCKAIKLLFGQTVGRYSFDFTSVATSFFADLNAEKGTLALVGAAEGVALDFAKFLSEKYPGIQTVYCRNGYFSDGVSMNLAAHEILSANPDFVLVGMGAVYQELFLLELMDAGYSGGAYTCGGFFDQTVSADGDYYPKWIDRMDLRWAYRLFKEPRRLAKRYFVDYFLAIFLLAWHREKRICRD